MMKIKKTIGIIGSGKHFFSKIYPVLSKSSFFKIAGVLLHNKKFFKNLNYYTEKDFFSKNFDFIYISCPNRFHEKYIMESLKNNSHVICEKPFLIKKDKIKKILSLSQKKKKLVFEAFMFLYHPVFSYVKKMLKQKKYGKLEYLISNFRFPSLDKKNHRYNYNGGGFFLDAACYLLVLENYLFNKVSLSYVFSQRVKDKFDLKGNIYIKSKINRFYFWGEGQNYSNNLEIFFSKASIFIDKFFSKQHNEVIIAKIHHNGQIIEKKFNQVNHFQEMFNVVAKNYKKISFQNFHRRKIKNQLNLLLNYNKH
jgi:predicted dehydrogenase